LPQQDLGDEGRPDAAQLRDDIRALLSECLTAVRQRDGQDTWRQLETRIAELQQRLETTTTFRLRD
jgi:hypothetical protein